MVITTKSQDEPSSLRVLFINSVWFEFYVSCIPGRDVGFYLLIIQATNSGLQELFCEGLLLPVNILPRFLAHLGTQSQFSILKKLKNM